MAESEAFCNNCGHRNRGDAPYCSSCGAVLESGSQGQSTITTITFHPVAPGDPTESGIEDGSATSIGQGTAGRDAAGRDAVAGSVSVGTLVVHQGPKAGSRILLDLPVTTIGRHPDSDVFLDDITVSRRHAEFRRGDGNVYEVVDSGSLNGTYVNRSRVERATLVDHDEVQIGKFKFVFLAGSAGAAT